MHREQGPDGEPEPRRRASSHQKKPPRKPRKRGIDHIEDAAAWLLTSLALIGVVLAVVIGVQVHSNVLDRARVEMAARTSASAVLLADTPQMAGTEGGEGRSPMAEVAVRWVGRDGAERVGEVRVQPPRYAGETVTVWTDRTGNLVPPPTTPVEAHFAAAAAAGLVLLALSGVLAALWNAIRRGTMALSRVQWEREWQQVEPVWSGRTRGGSMS
jgi:hypothetical protein